MTLLERTQIHADSFSLSSFSRMYARIGAGPSAAADFRVPQRTSCVIRRLLTQMYVLNRLRPGPDTVWPIRAPERIAVIELRGEKICFRMRHLAFFEEGLQLSTIVNTQIPWLSFESPLLTCLAGHGRVGIRIDGEPDCLAPSHSDVSPHVNLLRLAAWATDTRLGVAVEPGYANSILVAPAAAVVHTSSLVVCGRDDGETVGAPGLLKRIARLITP